MTVDNDGAVYRIDPNTGKGIGQPNLLNESVHASPLVLNADGTPTVSLRTQSIPRVAAGAVEKVYIVTTGGHVFEFDPDAGRTSQVVSK